MNKQCFQAKYLREGEEVILKGFQSVFVDFSGSVNSL